MKQKKKFPVDEQKHLIGKALMTTASLAALFVIAPNVSFAETTVAENTISENKETVPAELEMARTEKDDSSSVEPVLSQPTETEKTDEPVTSEKVMETEKETTPSGDSGETIEARMPSNTETISASTENVHSISTAGTTREATPSFQGTVNFVINRGNVTTVTKDFTSGAEALGTNGAPDNTGSSFSKAYFIGWSDVENFSNEEGKLWFAHETIESVFPEGLTEPKTLYATYYTALQAMMFASGATIEIDRGMQDTEVAPELSKSQKGVNGEAVNPFIDQKPENLVDGQPQKEAAFYYDMEKDMVNVLLNSSFTMNRPTAAFTFKNNGGILTNSGKNWTNPSKDADYTFVDLHVIIDSRIKMANELKFQFKSYNFKPHMLLTEDYQVIEWTKSQLESQNPISTITFNTDQLNGKNYFILRTTIRNDFNPAYTTNLASAQEVFGDMQLISGKEENYTVSKETMKKIALGEEQPLVIRGLVAGKIKPGGIPVKIPDITAKEVHLHFTPNQVTFDNNGMDLSSQTVGDPNVKVVHNSSIANDDFEAHNMPYEKMEIEKDGVKYTFKEWNTKADGTGDTFTSTTQVTEDITLYAIWNTPPTITAHGTEIFAGDKLDLKTLVDTATDKEDGDLKDKVDVKKGNYTNQTPGTYDVTFTVTDSGGLTATTTVKVVVKEAPNMPPTITAHGMEIFVGDELDLKTLVDTATDKEDGDLKDKVEVNAGAFTNQTPGTYDVTFTVKDSKGLTATATVKVIVKARSEDPKEPEEPVKPEEPTKPEKPTKSETSSTAKKLPQTGVGETSSLLMAAMGWIASGFALGKKKRK